MISGSVSLLPIDPILCIDLAGDGGLELSLDGILALQQWANKKTEAIAFISNASIDESDIVQTTVLR